VFLYVFSRMCWPVHLFFFKILYHNYAAVDGVFICPLPFAKRNQHSLNASLEAIVDCECC